MLFIRRFLSNYIFIVLLSVVIFHSPLWANDRVSFTILYTNDHHGAYWPDSKGNGGLVNRYAMIENVRREVNQQDGFVLLLDAGDVNTGTPESDLLQAEPDFKGMLVIGYDAMALGNHEFDKPLDVLYSQQKMVNFPFLSANVYDEENNSRLFKPYTVFERKGIKIGVFGLTTMNTKTVGSKKILAGIDFRPHTSDATIVLGRSDLTVVSNDIANNTLPSFI